MFKLTPSQLKCSYTCILIVFLRKKDTVCLNIKYRKVKRIQHDSTKIVRVCRRKIFAPLSGQRPFPMRQGIIRK